MTYTIRNRLATFLLLFFVLIIISYGAFRIYPLYAGPKIEIYTPKDGDTVASGTFEVSGKVTRAKETKLDGRPITINTEGLFKETLVAHAPYTILVFEATDKYGKTREKIIRVTVKTEAQMP